MGSGLPRLHANITLSPVEPYLNNSVIKAAYHGNFTQLKSEIKCDDNTELDMSMLVASSGNINDALSCTTSADESSCTTIADESSYTAAEIKGVFLIISLTQVMLDFLTYDFEYDIKYYKNPEDLMFNKVLDVILLIVEHFQNELQDELLNDNEVELRNTRFIGRMLALLDVVLHLPKKTLPIPIGIRPLHNGVLSYIEIPYRKAYELVEKVFGMFKGAKVTLAKLKPVVYYNIGDNVFVRSDSTC